MAKSDKEEPLTIKEISAIFEEAIESYEREHPYDELDFNDPAES